MKVLIYHPTDTEYLVPNSDKNKLARELADLVWEAYKPLIKEVKIQVGGPIPDEYKFVYCLEFSSEIFDYELLGRDFCLTYVRINQGLDETPDFIKYCQITSP